MPKLITLAPVTHPKTGEQFAAGVEVDVDDEVFAEWRADGKAAEVRTDPEPPGHYSERTGREDTTSTKPSKAKS